jgi:hypothetical protein
VEHIGTGIEQVQQEYTMDELNARLEELGQEMMGFVRLNARAGTGTSAYEAEYIRVSEDIDRTRELKAAIEEAELSELMRQKRIEEMSNYLNSTEAQFAKLEEGKTAQGRGFSKPYWIYMTAGSLFAVGMMIYELVAFHLNTTKIISPNSIPLLLTFATGSGVIASLVLGKLYDWFEMRTILGAVSLSPLFSPFLFWGVY